MTSEPEEQAQLPAEKPMPIRRKNHPKSRSGCKTCKTRKIKCDEHKPQCRNCIRHSVKCDFLSVPSPEPDSGGGELAVHDLELLHNFTTRTYATIAEGVEIRDLYRFTAVQMGLKHHFILRAILAISALHLAHYRPAQRDHFMYLAMRHHQIASRKAVEVMKEEVDIARAETLFLFSTLTSFFSIASSTSEQGHPALLRRDDDEGIPEWVFLQSGARFLTEFLLNHAPEMARGQLGLIFSDGIDRVEKRLKEAQLTPRRSASAELSPPEEGTSVTQKDVHRHLDSVRALIEKQVSDEKMRTTYLGAIDGLHQSFNVAAATGGHDPIDAFIWLFLVSEELTPLLRAPVGPKQEAVVLMTFYSALLKKLDGKWWGNGCGEQLLRRAWAMLDSEHRLWAGWPVEEMGWIPG